MFKEVLNYTANYTWFAETGLVIFAVVFVAVSIRTLTQKREDVKAWAMMPLDEESRSEEGGR